MKEQGSFIRIFLCIFQEKRSVILKKLQTVPDKITIETKKVQKSQEEKSYNQVTDSMKT